MQNIIRLATPPVFIRIAERLLAGHPCRDEWEYIPEGWVYAKTHPEVKGWNVGEVLETYKQKWPHFVAMVKGVGPLGVVHESSLATNEDIKNHNTMMSFAYTLALAAKHKGRLTMLDWGGGIGHYCLLAQTLLPGVEIEYHCKDVPLFCEYGSQLFPQQHFYSDERCFDRVYDFVIASTSLHYAEDWQPLLRRLAEVTRGYLYVANMPVVQHSPSFVFVQRPYRYGYNTEYLAWCLQQDEFLRIAELAGLYLRREFVYGHQPDIIGAPEQSAYRGYLFQACPGGRS